MLRSLVGSEMCIRDRARTMQRDFVEENKFPFIVPIPAIKPSPGVLLIKSCLLYTSDAADDLLCVDLGGRRIIKKKT